MATYTWNPNDVNVNANPIGNGWTARHNSLTSSAITSMTTPIGDRAWRMSRTSEAQTAFTLDAYSGGTEDQEILTLQRRSATTSELHNVVRVATSGNINYYIMGFRNNATDIRWRQVDNGTPSSTVDTVTTHGLTNLTDEWFWIRTKVTSTSAMRVKVWRHGDNEPSWMIESTGLTLAYSTGAVGVGGYFASTGNRDLAWFSVGTGTDEAPSPPPDVNTPTNLNAEQITATSARLTWDYEA